MPARLVTLFSLLWLLAGTAFAVQPDEVLDDPALESRARALSTNFRCLVCQNQSIDDSDAPLARDLRLLIRERLTRGDSDEQVVQYLVGRYGEFVLLKPRFGAHTLVLWIGPFVILLAGLAYILARRKRRQSVPAEAPLSADEQARLDALLKSDDT